MNDQNINESLLQNWDPIGIRGTSVAEDEYQQYANNIYKIIKYSDSHKELFEYLWKIETEHMGLRGNRLKTEEFAKSLFQKIKKDTRQ